MKREIKFRAWDNKLKKMIFTGFHLMGEVMAFNAVQQYLYENKAGVESTLERWPDIEIMQFTGLYDKNGKGIYEGDIVRQTFFDTDGSPITDINSVQFVSGCFEVDGYPLYTASVFEVEIIGNIFETPELLQP